MTTESSEGAPVDAGVEKTGVDQTIIDIDYRVEDVSRKELEEATKAVDGSVAVALGYLSYHLRESTNIASKVDEIDVDGIESNIADAETTASPELLNRILHKLIVNYAQRTNSWASRVNALIAQGDSVGNAPKKIRAEKQKLEQLMEFAKSRGIELGHTQVKG